MTAETWKVLQEHGVTESTELRLDFFYYAPDSTAAEQLAEFLGDETDYDVRVDGTSVTGSTQSTTVSADILKQWVEWMVLAGQDKGSCEFDGWGAAIPSTSS